MSGESRRGFLVSGTAAGLGAAAALTSPASARAVAQASERIVCAVIGVRGRGRSFYLPLAARRDTTVALLCDVDANVLGAAATAVARAQGQAPRTVEDFRRVLDDRAIDAVFIATPHHWHTPIALRALQAGKHVYVEKPASHVFREGQLLVQAGNRYGRVVQHGTQMRSSEVTERARELLRSGAIGDVKMAKAWNVQRHTHRQPVADGQAPKGVNYDLWLGPAPARPFNANRFHGNWQWYRDYGNGDIGNDGIHDLDMACMGLGVDRLPVRITAHGSRIDLLGEREYPDNMLVSYQFDNNKVLIYEDRGWTHYGMNGLDSGNEFYGTRGYMRFTRRGSFQVYLDSRGTKGPSFRGDTGGERHLQNFLDCIRNGRRTNADALTAHLSCALVHLGEIAHRVQRVLHFDPRTETITNDREANALLTKEYRQPWELPRVES
jgi:predicted dehydrogenase